MVQVQMQIGHGNNCNRTVMVLSLGVIELPGPVVVAIKSSNLGQALALLTVVTLGAQNFVSISDQYKREATCEYSCKFGFVFSMSRMSGHSYMTRFAVSSGVGLVSPPAAQRSTAAECKVFPNFDGSEGQGNHLTAPSSRGRWRLRMSMTSSRISSSLLPHFPDLRLPVAQAGFQYSDRQVK